MSRVVAWQLPPWTRKAASAQPCASTGQRMGWRAGAHSLAAMACLWTFCSRRSCSDCSGSGSGSAAADDFALRPKELLRFIDLLLGDGWAADAMASPAEARGLAVDRAPGASVSMAGALVRPEKERLRVMRRPVEPDGCVGCAFAEPAAMGSLGVLFLSFPNESVRLSSPMSKAARRRSSLVS